MKKDKNRETHPLCIFGEVLFDLFPDGNRVPGGAPFNLAWHLQAFGQKPRFISRIGSDAAGQSMRTAMQAWGIDTRFLQTDPVHPTGRVEIHIQAGEPHYTIVPDSAYDFISAEEMNDPGSGLLCHGSLALRNTVSANTLSALKARHTGLVFLDVNLRTPWWQRDTILALMDDAHWVKLNESELRMLYPQEKPLAQLVQDVLRTHLLEGLVVTRGERGALAVTAGSAPVQTVPGSRIEVIDTVGAGDAFAAVLVTGILKHWPLVLTMERAQAFASRLIGKQGATVQNRDFYRPLLKEWALEA